MAPALLIRYGRPGFVGRFASAVPAARGERVVVRGPRGDELGEVLLPLDGAGPDGTVLRAATPADDAAAARLDAAAQQVLAAAGEGAAALGLPLAFVDAEATLDGVAVLHALPWDGCDATPLLDDLAARSGLAVRLLDLSRSAGEAPDPGCGKPGCGTGGGCSTGGCSTGSCSRGSASADELTAHFADLRCRMEAAGMVRTPLN
ncbi:MAG: hypothetical protein C0501_22835 [Isosphaera sp.]|nr:hypothetical protein [Isosphaera sp.]